MDDEGKEEVNDTEIEDAVKNHETLNLGQVDQRASHRNVFGMYASFAYRLDLSRGGALVPACILGIS